MATLDPVAPSVPTGPFAWIANAIMYAGWHTFAFIITPILWVMTFVKTMYVNIDTVHAYLTTAHGTLSGIAGSVHGLSIGDYFSKINTVVPLYETMWATGIVIQYYCASTIIRIIKSFIPTIS